MQRAACALVAVILTSCSAGAISSRPNPTASLTASATSTPTVEPTPTPSPTTAPPAQLKPGETLTITQGGTDILAIVVSKVQFVSSYPDLSAYPVLSRQPRSWQCVRAALRGVHRARLRGEL